MIERFDMPELKDSFIGAWVMPEPIIDSIWDYWQSEKDKRFKGEVASGKPELKKSTDLEISAYDETPIW